MDPILFASFMIATFLIVIPPGPSVALASSQAVRHGPRAAVLTVMGDALGSVVHILIAVIGLNVLIGIADVVLPFLQMLGGGFILYLAYQSFFGSADDASQPRGLGPDRSAFLSGFFACVTNPKAIVFFVALFPGFISPDLHIGFQSLVYGAIFVTLDAMSILVYAMLARALVRSAIAPRIDIDKISGLGLFGVGAMMVVKGYRAIPSQS